MKEIWRPVQEFEELYEVSNWGRVKSLRRNSIMSPTAAANGYLKIKLRKGKLYLSFKMHRLVAIHFIYNRQRKEQVNHKNGNKHDNVVSNLEWMTRIENMRHSFKNGFHSRRVGIQSSNHILSEEEVLAIRNLSGELFQREIANRYQISQGHVSNILLRRSWTHI